MFEGFIDCSISVKCCFCFHFICVSLLVFVEAAWVTIYVKTVLNKLTLISFDSCGTEYSCMYRLRAQSRVTSLVPIILR